MKPFKYVTTLISLLSISVIGNGQSNISGPLDIYVYPAKDQDQDQQELDEYKCYKWAQEQTGINPIALPEVEPEKQNTGPDGSGIRGAARGAAAGAAIGAIAGDTGKGAAIGATAGALRGAGNRARREAYSQQQAIKEAEDKEKAMLTSFKKAYAACLEGKGYTVKY